MNEPNFDIRHGEFHNATGPPRRFHAITFLPARVTLGGTSFDFTHHLHNYLTDAPAGTKALVKPSNNAAWVLGRLMHVFGIQLEAEEDRQEKSCFAESFIAVLHARDNLSIPFCCTDFYCTSSLIFTSDDPPQTTVQDEIAAGFWAMLLDSPTDLIDYDSRLFHSGACTWIEFGVKDGEPYVHESEGK